MNSIDKLIHLLSRLPGLGPRSARRVALVIIKKNESLLSPLQEALNEIKYNIKECEICGNIDTQSPCGICLNNKRDMTQLCVLEEVADLWAMERTTAFKGYYHVLGGRLSAIEGVGPEDLKIAKLVDRARNDDIKEVILATNLTVDGETTANYIADCLSSTNVRVTRLAHGVPVGGELDYLDGGTLTAALKARQKVNS